MHGTGILMMAAKRLKMKFRDPIDPKVSPEDCKIISRTIYDIVTEHGPLTVANAWDHVQAAGLRALTSKKHMKIMLKWMKERNMVKVASNPEGPLLPCVYTTGISKP